MAHNLKLPTLIDNLVELEQIIESVREKARHADHRMMRESDGDGQAKPNLALMELAVRALGQAKDAVRYARHATKGDFNP